MITSQRMERLMSDLEDWFEDLVHSGLLAGGRKPSTDLAQSLHSDLVAMAAGVFFYIKMHPVPTVHAARPLGRLRRAGGVALRQITSTPNLAKASSVGLSTWLVSALVYYRPGLGQGV